MKLLKYNRNRLLKLLIFTTMLSVLAYFSHFFYIWRTAGYPEKIASIPVRIKKVQSTPDRIKHQHHVTEKILPVVTQHDVMSDRIQTVNARCQDDEIIRKSKRFRFPIASNSESPFYRYKRARTCMCKVPKVASTMLSKLLLASEFPMNVSYIKNMPGYYVHDVNLTSRFQHDSCGINEKLQFVVVRNPYSRIYSAYIDKVFLGKFKSFTAKIQYFTGENTSARSYFDDDIEASKSFMCKGHDVTFDAFLRWILFHYKVDWHFAPITTFCNPCDNPFNAIIKQENIRDEMKYVTERLPVSMDTTAFTDSSNENKIFDLIVILNDLLNGSMVRRECGLRYTNFTFINERFWNSLKMQGYISMHESTNKVVFRPFSSSEDAFDRFKALKVPFLNSAERSTQRQAYLVKAYQTLDTNLIKHFKFRFYADFRLFGYSSDPPS